MLMYQKNEKYIYCARIAIGYVCAKYNCQAMSLWQY